eukprot:TRINITY_DN11509_c0_g1_i1.p1 TRINITY_DN11509_c0_g1~~TRINITY_DN11509_c0_g1_i1.p1  ORF type:complete len:470 (+),score=77.86 TRINITY_DN11509_c0_g1_i1:2-1411(+)
MKGDCFKCGGMKRIYTLFVEAGKKREAIWTFEGKDEKLLSNQIEKFLRCAPSTSKDRAIMDEEVSFTRLVHPDNFRAKVLPPDFLYPENAIKMDLNERRDLFYSVISKHVRTKSSWKLNVRRSHLLEDAFAAFDTASPEDIRGTLKVTFIGEEASDWGGVSREFFQLVSEGLLDPRVNLFLPKGPNNTYHPSPSSYVNEGHLKYFRFFGRFLGKALLDKRLVKAPFTRAVYKLFLGKGLEFTDFQTVDKQTYIQLRQTIGFDADVLESCDFVFAATIEDFGRHKTCPLKHNGENIVVTKDNLFEWIKLYSSWKMVDSVEAQLLHFLFGFYEIIPVQAVQIFNEFELEQLLNGLQKVDLENWRANSVVMGISKSSKQRAAWFWEILEEFGNDRRVQVLQFVTGSAQVPVSFEHLFPPFTIGFSSSLRNDSLPYGHTCFNRIDLPYYTSKEQMKDRIEKMLDLGLVGFTRK